MVLIYRQEISAVAAATGLVLTHTT